MAEKRTLISELTPNQPIDQVFLVRQKELRTTRSGEYYISAMLGDRSGQVPARMWQATETIYNSVPVEGFIHVRGRADDYRGTLQVVIEALRPVAAEKVDVGEYLAVSPFDIEEMWSELLEILRGIHNRHIRGLIKKFVEDKQLVGAFKKAPAAVQMHHPYIGGLLEHTLNVARDAKALLPLYPRLNADVVLAGIFLHDIAKCAELTSGLAIHYTDRGQLVGHITIAVLWVHEKAHLLGEELGEPFPRKLLDVLDHIILSHHGQHDFGSPKLPAMPEAYFIHYLDNLDAKMFMTTAAIDADPDDASSFTGWVPALQTRLYKLGDINTPDEEPGLFE
jgi:3'-5' exoribonuclease